MLMKSDKQGEEAKWLVPCTYSHLSYLRMKKQMVLLSVCIFVREKSKHHRCKTHIPFHMAHMVRVWLWVCDYRRCFWSLTSFPTFQSALTLGARNYPFSSRHTPSYLSRDLRMLSWKGHSSGHSDIIAECVPLLGSVQGTHLMKNFWSCTQIRKFGTKVKKT